MGGLIARRATERLATRLRGLLLIDPTPETSPVYDNWEKTVEQTDHMLAVTQALSHLRPLAGQFSPPLASAQALAETVSMSKIANAPRLVIAFVGLIHVPVTVLTWLDLRSRPAAQIRGSKVIWRLASALNTTGSVAYWLFGRRRSTPEASAIS